MAGKYQDPLLGSLLDGRYRVLQLLGQGGMGNVYLADETRLQRRTALKVLHPHLARERAHVDRFLREAQSIAQFKHPNIVDIVSYGEEPNGVVFFAMEMLSGEDLDARVKGRGERPYTTYEACNWAIQVARAVAVVHDAGLIHRDLKVSNIFLSRRRDGTEVIKLLDFGIARREEGSELTATGVSLGTPSYMAPEQMTRRPIDRRADIYSFGVVLFKVVTGELPFTGDPIQVALQHRDSPPPSPSKVAPAVGISPELEHIILTALAKDPADRFQSMEAMEAALLAVLDAEAPEMLPTARPGRFASLSQISAVRPVTNPPSWTTPVPANINIAEATPGPSTHRTGAASTTTATAPHGPRSNRLLFAVTGGSLLTAALLLTAVLMRSDSTDPAVHTPAASLVSATPVPVVAATPPTLIQAEPPALPTPPEPPIERDPPPPERDSPPPDRPVQDPPVIEVAPQHPVTQPPVVKPRTPPGEPTAGKKPADPLAQVSAKASKCRRKFKATKDPKIAVKYWISTDGTVRDAKAALAGPLGDCLAEAVAQVRFPPKLELGKKIDL